MTSTEARIVRCLVDATLDGAFFEVGHPFFGGILVTLFILVRDEEGNGVSIIMNIEWCFEVLNETGRI